MKHLPLDRRWRNQTQPSPIVVAIIQHAASQDGRQPAQLLEFAEILPLKPTPAPSDSSSEDARNYLGRELTITIDRPLGSQHSSQGFIYPVNYGYLPDTPAPDGDNLDAYLLGVFEPVAQFTGHCIAIIHRLDDDDDKLIIVPDHCAFTDAQIRALTEFQERFFTSVILRIKA